ncbi:hypothetical protein V5O48_014514 [Marasmius crinis-equi]|uniref:ABM domain-containing protein n=1 Tax=Marasmius crinis-equi TaxID=585013 RepID=A0ABR3EX24_9AGAR
MYFKALPVLSILVVAHAAYGIETQTITIQNLPLKASSSQGDVQNLKDAMSQFKTSYNQKISSAYLGFIESPDASPIAQQIFLWNNPDDSEHLNVTQPFIKFASSPHVNVSTATLNNKTALIESLRAPSTETVIEELVPEVNIDRFTSVLEEGGVKIRDSPEGYGSAFGFIEDHGKRVLVFVNGWVSPEGAANWIANMDNATAAIFQEYLAALVGGISRPTFKQLLEIE